MKQFLSVTEAKTILDRETAALPMEEIPLEEAVGRVAAVDVHAPLDMPSFDNSAMDGYALIWEEGRESYTLVGEIAAGDGRAQQLVQGQAMRIFTGAPVPLGADTVVQQEWSSKEGDQVHFEGNVKRGMHIRRRGTQCRQGESILKAGTRITPGAIALLSSVGINRIAVHRLPVVQVLVTGNEIAAPGTELPPGAVYNTNGPFLGAYLKQSGFPVQVHGPVPDEPETLRKSIHDALLNCDVLILTGGISVGEYDFVQPMLLEAGAHPFFYKLKQKPGKPIWAGRVGNTIVFALPGNPASVITCANQYVMPVLKKMAGFQDVFEPDARLPLRQDYHKKAGLTQILKVQVAEGQVKVPGGQESFNLLPFAEANALAIIPENTELALAGTKVDVFYL